MSKFFSKRRFHLSSPANLMPSFSSSSDYNNNSSKKANSSSSPCSSSSSPCESSMNGGFSSPQSQKRLTRQRKLRHVTVENFCMPEEDDGDRSKSLPGSPNSESRSSHRLLQHWSLSAVPQPLPLPNDEFRFHAEEYSRGDGRCRSHQCGMNPKACGDLISSKPSTYHRRRGYPQDVNGEKVGCGIRLDVPPRSAPATTFTSPALSPKRFSTVDIFDSAFAVPQELRVSPPSRRSPVHSPPSQSPYLKVHLLNNKSPPERTESNNTNVHPLPLPPGVSRPVSSRRSLDKSDGQSTKGQWQKGKLLGRGTYGSVYEATNRETGSLCALKEVDVIPDDTKSSECIRQLEQEIKVLRNLEHPNIVQYLGSEVVEDKFCIYLEHVHPGSISKYVRERCGAVTESVVRNFTRHILSGLAYLHSKKTVHRDIKGANLLVDSSGVVKLADFGLAKHLSPHVIDLSLKGTPHWMAPEVLQAAMRKDTNEHTYTMDIWSLGCTVIEMVTGKPPWSELSSVQAMFNVLHRSPPIPETLSSEGKDFLHRCLQRNPENRSTAALLLEHPFVRNSFDHNLALCNREVSGLRSNEISYNPRDSPAHHKDIPGTWVRHGRLQFHRETPKHLQPKTTRDHSPATRHSPRSTLEALPCVSSSEFNFSPTRWGNSRIPNRMPAEGGRTYSLPTTPNRETYLL
ncbi:mitogen-activated protein kinase kinase kinase 5-like isoform X1 [Cynara cardunculus var. scolymus]|uniref:mitogen-activated protein kinase kinase kinase 5-like isoform X1 n=1 Tax=Cynara cardunculus var. scolymus TaxID=59895 RepID=UPI000D625316|nr:mitogen-activated protein kinase kinase kinase 5-like isoform X1 [Cynara cardunculus var. scolymus]